MCALKEKAPEDVMGKPREEGYTFFTGLPTAKEGEVHTHRKFRTKGVNACLSASPRTRAAILDFLSGLEFVQAARKEDLGTTLLEIGCLFEIRTRTRMPRRCPPNKNPQERLTEKGARSQTN